MMKYLFTGVLVDFILTKDKTELQISVDDDHDIHFNISALADFSMIQELLGKTCTVVGVIDMLHPKEVMQAEKILTNNDQQMTIQELLGTPTLQTDQGDEPEPASPDADAPVVYAAKQTTPSVQDLTVNANLGELGTGIDASKLKESLNRVEVPKSMKPVTVTSDDLTGESQLPKEKKRIFYNDQGQQVEEPTQSETDENTDEALGDLPMN